MADIYYKDILIVGGGPVGIFTAFQSRLRKLSCALLEASDKLGGQCAHLYPEKPIYDIPAYKSITGEELVKNLLEQANAFEQDYRLETWIDSIEHQEEYILVKTNKDETLKTKAIILSAGVGSFTPKEPEPFECDDKTNIHLFVNDKSIFANKVVTIFGGGDSAIDWAIELSYIAKSVNLVHRNDRFRCIQSKKDLLVQRVKNIYTFEQIKKFINGQVYLENHQFHSDKLLFCFGLAPDLSRLTKLGIDVRNNGKIPVNHNYQTNISNIYAIGDIAIYENKVPYIMVGFSEGALLVNYLRKVILNDTSKPKHSSDLFA